MTFQDVVNEVKVMRKNWGDDICTDPKMVSNSVAAYTFMPGENLGYVQEYDLETGKERHCGLARECFWTPWQ